MTISALPGALPQPTDTPDVFNAKAFTVLGALPTLITEINAEVVAINNASTAATTGAATSTNRATAATTSATAASGSATNAANSATAASGSATVANSKAAEASASATSAAVSAAATLGQIFATGTRVPFAQAAAPTGWTRDVSDNANNRMLRVVSSAGGGVGGSHNPIVNDVVPWHSHGFTTGGVSSDHTHIVNDPSHNHSTPWGNGGALFLQPSGQVQAGGVTGYSTTGIWLSGSNANHSHSGTTDGGSSQTSWTPRYLDLIVCIKN